jgi:AcrR family transcriptional regulator
MEAGESFDALSLRSVVRAAGVVPTAFYRHFSSMDELGLALVDESFRTLRVMLREAREGGSAPDHMIKRSVEIAGLLVNGMIATVDAIRDVPVAALEAEAAISRVTEKQMRLVMLAVPHWHSGDGPLATRARGAITTVAHSDAERPPARSPSGTLVVGLGRSRPGDRAAGGAIAAPHPGTRNPGAGAACGPTLGALAAAEPDPGDGAGTARVPARRRQRSR